MIVVGYLLSILMGLSLGLVGGGGSILTVPILMYFFGQDPLVATMGSLFVVGVIAVFGAAMNIRSGNVELKTSFLFAVPSFLGVFLTRSVILPAIPEYISVLQNVQITKSGLVLFSFAALMLVAAVSMIRSSGNRVEAVVSAERSLGDWFNIAVKGFFVGVITAFVGAGGGFLIIPALVVLLRMPMRKAVGTSLVIIAANSIFGFSISLDQQPISWGVLLGVTALGLAGLFAGHRLSSKINEAPLKRGFGYFVLLVGVLILADQAGLF